MNQELFKSYTTDDFILDEYFIEIIREGNNEKLTFLLNSIPEKHKEINLALKILQELSRGEITHDDLRKKELWNQVARKQTTRKLFFYFKYAASLFLLIAIGSTFFYSSKHKQPEAIIADTEIPSDKSTLILADGSAISIDSEQSKIEYSEDGSGILVNDSADIAQTIPDEGYNQLIVPFGKRSFITLSEGTKVWLNSGSKLIFPPVFRGNTREVVLEGEGYFEVAHNAAKPFYVKTDDFNIKVYGTKFNIQAYKQDLSQNLVLVDGKVSLNSLNDSNTPEVFLTPNQKASIVKGENKFDISAVENVEVYTAWIEGYLSFTNEQVGDLLKRVSRYYNIDIETNFSTNTEKIYGKLDLKDDLSRVLNGIAFISKTKYKKMGNKYVFYE